MRRKTINEVKSTKNFYRNMYRRSLAITIFFFVIALLQLTGIVYVYITKPAAEYYATSGVVPPIKLQPMEQPNRTSQYLLPPDTPDEMSVGKAIPN